MTLVHFAPVGNGTTTPKGYIEGRMIGADPLTDSFRAVLIDGEVTVELAQTTVAQAWNIIERVDYGTDQYVQVGAAVGPVDYDTLTVVNGDDFSPTVEPGPGWVAQLALKQDVATVPDAIATFAETESLAVITTSPAGDITLEAFGA